jgi:drug/metabolite transporter (DMT)-like permease
VATILALVAAFLFAVAATFQQRGALELGVGKVSMGNPRSLLALAEQRWWLLGTLALLIAYGVQAAALDRGRLAIIQPLLVTTIVFALPLGHWMTNQHVGRREIVGSAIVIFGLSLFAIVGDPAGGRKDAVGWQWAITIAIVAGVCAFLLVSASGHGAPARKAALYGITAGILFGTSACLVKPTVETLHEGAEAVFTNWESYAFIVAGGLAFVLQQVSLGTGRLATSVATVSVANPVVSVIIGISLFDERLQRPLWHAIIASGGLALAMGGAILISRASEGLKKPAEPAPAAVPA